MAAGLGGTTWFTGIDAKHVPIIGEITPGGLVHEFPTGDDAANSNPNGIVAGPDGNMWFTNNGSFDVGRITPDGVVTEFDPTSPGAATQNIAVGQDGNLWFSSNSAIVRVTPAAR